MLRNLICNKKMAKNSINRLKVVLAEKERTNKWLSNKLGKNTATMPRWCTNEMQPSLATLKEIAIILDVDIKELLISTKN